jgi:hypothetical protein
MFTITNLLQYLGIILALVQVIGGFYCIFQFFRTKTKGLLYLGIAFIILGLFYLVEHYKCYIDLF